MRRLLLTPLLMALILAGCAGNDADESTNGDEDAAGGGVGELNGEVQVVNDSTMETDPSNPTPGGNESTQN